MATEYIKLATYVESIPRLSITQSAQEVFQFRAHLASLYPDDLPATSSQRYRNNELDLLGSPYLEQLSVVTLASSIASVLDTPRKIKFVLRRVREAWHNLHGEVNVDELLLVNVLRESGRVISLGDSSELLCFDLVAKNIKWLRSTSLRERTDRQRTPEQSALSNLLHENSDPEAMIVQALFGRGAQAASHAIPGNSQAVVDNEPTDYWARILAEEIDCEVSDQSMLASIFTFNHPSSPKSNRLPQSLASCLWDRGFVAAKLIQFSHLIAEEKLRELLEETLAQFGNENLLAHVLSSSENPQALINLALLCDHVACPQKYREEIIRKFIPRSLDWNLALTHEIEYWLVNRPGRIEHRVPDDADFRQSIREFINETLTDKLASEHGIDVLISRTTIKQPYTLHWLLRRTWDESLPNPNGHDWAAISDSMLLAATRSVRVACLLAIALSVTRGDRSARPPGLDIDFSQAMFAGKWRDLLQVLANTTCDELSGEPASVVVSVRESAMSILASNQ